MVLLAPGVEGPDWWLAGLVWVGRIRWRDMRPGSSLSVVEPLWLGLVRGDERRSRHDDRLRFSVQGELTRAASLPGTRIWEELMPWERM